MAFKPHPRDTTDAEELVRTAALSSIAWPVGLFRCFEFSADNITGVINERLHSVCTSKKVTRRLVNRQRAAGEIIALTWSYEVLIHVRRDTVGTLGD